MEAMNALTKFYAFAKMSMTRDRRCGLPDHNNYSPLQGGIIAASAFTSIALGSYIGAWVSIIVLGVLFVLSENKESRHYYAEFLKLPSKVQKKWTIFSWILTAVLWIYILAMIFAS